MELNPKHGTKTKNIRRKQGNLEENVEKLVDIYVKGIYKKLKTWTPIMSRKSMQFQGNFILLICYNYKTNEISSLLL